MRDHAGRASFRRLKPSLSRHILRPEYLLMLLLFLVPGCGLRTERREMPAEVEAAINTIGNDIAAERYEKIYNEASDLWKQDSTLEQSTAVLKTMRTKLGSVKNRIMHSATEQQNSGGPLKGRSFTVTYQTNFEKGEGMESFTLVERDQQWLLARYRVNSTELK
jgi:Protein of unknown function (DUF4019)